MSRSVIQLQDLFFTGRLRRAAVAPAPSAPWSLAESAGRLVEISGAGNTASLTLAFGLVLEAQRQGEPVSWVTPRESFFYPPDAAEGGVDLDALVVIRLPDVRAVPRAGDRLVRSGAFGLVVLDVGTAGIPTPLQARLVGLAQKHHTALICLTEKASEAPSLGSLVSLRIHGQRTRISAGRFTPNHQKGTDICPWINGKIFQKGNSPNLGLLSCGSGFTCGFRVLKDKRRGTIWTQQREVCRGPAGLC